jgi:integral membrane sensor domain MASE1
MDSIILILLVVAAIKFVVFGVILFFVFRPELPSLQRWKRSKTAPVDVTPTCVYCQSRYSRPTGEVETRWEGEELVLVTTFECEHCHFPLWRVERIPVGMLKR